MDVLPPRTRPKDPASDRWRGSGTSVGDNRGGLYTWKRGGGRRYHTCQPYRFDLGRRVPREVEGMLGLYPLIEPLDCRRVVTPRRGMDVGRDEPDRRDSPYSSPPRLPFQATFGRPVYAELLSRSQPGSQETVGDNVARRPAPTHLTPFGTTVHDHESPWGRTSKQGTIVRLVDNKEREQQGRSATTACRREGPVGLLLRILSKPLGSMGLQKLGGN